VDTTTTITNKQAIMTIDFKTASDNVVDSYMQSQGIALIDPTTIPRDQATGLYALAPIVAYVTEKNKNRANEALRNSLTNNPELNEKIVRLRVNGSGHEISTADLPTIVELIMVLPGKRAKQFRRVCANYIVRILGGDRTLIREIESQDERLNQTEAGRQFQQSALSSVNVQLDTREREARLARMEAENARMQTENKKMQTENKEVELAHFTKLKELTMDAGAWGPQNEQAYLEFLQHGMQSMAGRPLLTDGSSTTLYAIGPYMAKHHPEYHPEDNYKTLGMITAHLFRLRHRPDNTTLSPSPKNDPLLKKAFFADDVTKNGTSQISAKAYESCDQDLIEMAFACVNQGLTIKQVKNLFGRKGLNWADEALKSVEAFTDAINDDDDDDSDTDESSECSSKFDAYVCPRRSQRRRLL
jgi:hypothetical protein